MFEDFYYCKDNSNNVLDEIDTTPKLAVSNSKMNLTIKKNHKSK